MTVLELQHMLCRMWPEKTELVLSTTPRNLPLICRMVAAHVWTHNINAYNYGSYTSHTCMQDFGFDCRDLRQQLTHLETHGELDLL